MYCNFLDFANKTYCRKIMGVGDGELCPWASTHRGKWGQLTPLDNGYEKLKSENMQKTAVFYVYVIFREQSGQAGVENGAMLTTYSYILQNAPFRSQIFKMFFASGGKGGIDPP